MRHEKTLRKFFVSKKSRSDFLGQEIICQKGKCFEAGTLESEFDSLFDKGNIVEQIQLDLLKNLLG